MPVRQYSAEIHTRGFCDVHNLNEMIASSVASSGISDGLVTVFVPGSTAGITTIEFEPGVIEDLKRAVERLAPSSIHYDHDARWGDGNGFSHVRASLLGPSLTIPLSSGSMQSGTWQQVVLVDFDNRPRHRKVIVQVMGD
jgi:secondary thiamine-phosphate synthase enzyme